MTAHNHVLECGQSVLPKMGGLAARRSSEVGGDLVSRASLRRLRPQESESLS
jgi:hypothetical protein